MCYVYCMCYVYYCVYNKASGFVVRTMELTPDQICHYTIFVA